MKKEIKFAHNAELQDPRKTVKNRVFGLPRLYFRKLLHELSVWHGDYCWEERGFCVCVCVVLLLLFLGGAERSKAERSEAKRSVA